MPRKIAGSEMITIELSSVAMNMPNVVLDRAVHLYRSPWVATAGDDATASSGPRTKKLTFTSRYESSSGNCKWARDVAKGEMSKNTIKTVVLLAGLGGLIMLIGSLFGQQGLIFGAIIAFAMVGGSYWFSDTIAIKAARAVPVSETEMPDYYRVVRELTQQAGMPMPKLYVTPDLQPNAFATGRNPHHAAVAVTQGIMRTLDWDELRGVLAHEISHVGNRDILIGSVAAAVAMMITFIARMAMFSAMFGGGGRDDREGNIFG